MRTFFRGISQILVNLFIINEDNSGKFSIFKFEREFNKVYFFIIINFLIFPQLFSCKNSLYILAFFFK